MLQTTNNYEIICFQMWANSAILKPALKKELDEILSNIRVFLINKNTVKQHLNDILPSVFNFRIKAIKWLIENDTSNPSEILDEVYLKFEELKKNNIFGILIENILFALRCNKRVVGEYAGTGNFSVKSFKAYASALPAITYEQFLSSIAFNVPDNDMAQKFVDWVNSSLYIESIILSALIIKEEKLNVEDEVINELSFLIADAAQVYSAIAVELGVIKTNSKNHPAFTFQIAEAVIKEQKYLAELGINDFAESI